MMSESDPDVAHGHGLTMWSLGAGFGFAVGALTAGTSAFAAASRVVFFAAVLLVVARAARRYS